MIEGVQIKTLKVFSDDRGCLMEVVKEDDALFMEIRQTTFTIAYPGIIKAFHWHRQQFDIWFFTSGSAQVVLHDLREKSKTRGQTQVVYMGERNPVALLIPPEVAHGYRVLGDKPAGLIYHTTRAYNAESPDEERISFDDPAIGFDWNTKPR